MSKPKDNVAIWFCPNPACGNLHIEFSDHPEHGEVVFVLSPEHARAFADMIIKVLDNSNVLTH